MINNNTEAASTKDGTPKQNASWYKKAKQVLLVLSQAVLLAPLKLPAKIKAGAQYVGLLLGVLDSLEKQDEQDKEVEDDG